MKVMISSNCNQSIEKELFWQSIIIIIINENISSVKMNWRCWMAMIWFSFVPWIYNLKTLQKMVQLWIEINNINSFHTHHNRTMNKERTKWKSLTHTFLSREKMIDWFNSILSSGWIDGKKHPKYNTHNDANISSVGHFFFLSQSFILTILYLLFGLILWFLSSVIVVVIIIDRHSFFSVTLLQHTLESSFKWMNTNSLE